MLRYIARRLVMLIPILILMSLVAFILIQLPPGDYVTYRINQLALSGIETSEAEAERLMREFGLDLPMPLRYWRWVSNIVTSGNWGWSMQWSKPVWEVLAPRLPNTILISLGSLLLSWAIAIPIGIFSATHQYSVLDYVATFLGFFGVATPGFLIALILAWVVFTRLGYSPLGLFSVEFLDKPWSWPKVADLLKHVWLPLTMVGLSSTGSTIRVIRNNLLDELQKQYVVTARAKGLKEWRLLLKYPVRMAINPLLSTMSSILPGLVSGAVLIDIILNLQTLGPVLMRATLAQDMYLAGSITLILSAMTVIGALLGDLLLAVADPRIRFGRAGR